MEEAGIKYPIKLEYYKIARDENVKNTNQVNDINEADRILTLLRNNEVTPIGVEDVLEDLQKV